MPVFNNARFLSASIESIINQTYSSFEFIILNDGSTDGSDSIINNYAKLDDRIVFINDPINKGLVYRLNQGLKIATGEFIARADSDDICQLTRFEKQLEFLDANPNITVCSACFEYIGMRQGKVSLPLTDEEIKISLLDKCTIVHPLVIFRRLFFLENNLEYDPLAIAAEDYDLWTRIAGKVHFGNLPEVLLKYRISSTQVSKQKEDLQWGNSDKCRVRMLNYIWDFGNDEDKRYAGLIARPHSISRLEDVEKVFEILDDLVLRNRGVQFFNETGFDHFVRNRKKILARFFYHNKRIYNHKVFLEFYNSPGTFKKELSAVDKIKIIIKCLILWQKKK